ncbi:hypothetical protein WIS52_18770 [Pseudonocardia nematodicida]|uniref:DUF3558 domain-containing protein n=1 Tax=Pseudonocardia nematodicida TaxID=1206997 RepID=A0ABV1KDH9_9PSEU
MVGRVESSVSGTDTRARRTPSERAGRTVVPRSLPARGALFAGIALVTSLLAGCGIASGEPGIAVPTFATEDPGSAGADAEPIAIALPTDCADLMDPEQAGALFGQVLGSVSVQSVRGVAEPAVNRTERTACTYRAGGMQDAGAPGARNSGPVLYQLNIGRYGDTASATRQWQLNTNAERANAIGSRDVTVGSVAGVLIERPDETTLALVYGVDTLTFVLPAGAPGQSRPAGETLPDLAQRIIPALTPTQPASAQPSEPSAVPSSTPGPAEPAPQADRGRAGAPGTT